MAPQLISALEKYAICKLLEAISEFLYKGKRHVPVRQP